MGSIECVALLKVLHSIAGPRLISKSFTSTEAVLSLPGKVWHGHGHVAQQSFEIILTIIYNV